MTPPTTRTAIPALAPASLRAASIWLALAVALLSSVLSGGLPRTTALGSAFNPATTAVALQPTRTQPRVMAEQLRRDDDPAGERSFVPSVRSSLQPDLRPAVATEAPKPVARPLPIEPHDGLTGSPRGPPRA